MGGPDASVRCVRCGEPLAGVTSDSCPRCGMPVSASLGMGGGVGQLPQAPAAPASELAGAGGAPPTTGAGGYEAPLFPPAPPPAAAYPQYPQAEPPQQPPTYPPYPPYGQPAAPSTPLYPPAGYPTGYPQFAPPSVPLSGQYGQPAGPSVPYYGQPAGPSVPYYGPPGMPAPWTVPLAPVKKGRTGLIVGLLVALLVVVAGGGTAAVLALSHNGTGAASGTPTSTSGPTATATPNILFQDALTSNINGWTNDANCFFKSDGYHSKGYICYAPYTPPANVDIALDTVQISGGTQHSRGIVFRRTSRGNYYGFDVTADGYWVFYKSVNGTPSVIHDYTINSVIRQGLNTSNTLRVVAKGTQFTFYVNDTLVGSATDATFSSGICGVASVQGTEDVFRNLIIASDG